MSQDISFWPRLSPIDTGTDFAVEHWFGCCATEPSYAEDIGAIEIWLIDLYFSCLGWLEIGRICYIWRAHKYIKILHNQWKSRNR